MSSRFSYLLKKFFLFRFCFFVLTICGIVGVIVLGIFFSNKRPNLQAVSSNVLTTGDTVALTGSYFGQKYDSSWIQIGESIIQSENCDVWTDDKIIFKYPEHQAPGLLFIVVKNKKSNPIFLANSSYIPVVTNKFVPQEAPSISSLSRDFAEVGSILKISGENFGGSHVNTDVMFVPNFTSTMLHLIEQGDDVGAAFCSDYNFDFISWANEEIQVRVPDGADSGAIIVKTVKGLSNPVSFRIKNKVGTKTRSNKKSITVATEVDVFDISSEEKNSIFLKIPLPLETYSQKNVEIVSIEPSPFVKKYQNASIHRYENVGASTKIHIRQEYSVNVYEVQTKINPVNVRVDQKQNKALYNAYAVSTEFLPSNDVSIQKLVSKILANEKNPYTKAKKIYNYILNEFDIIPVNLFKTKFSVAEVFANKKVTPYDATILYATFLRACGIPAQPIAGIITDVSQNTYSHWWNEFYLEGFGWIPVDIGMAKNVPFDIGIPQKDKWYFGNIDSFRVIFSCGKNLQTPMVLNSKNVANEYSYSFASSWEEYLGLNSYKSVWRVPMLVSIY